MTETAKHWILVSGELVDKIRAAGIDFGDPLVELALERHLTNILRSRKYKEKMRSDPATKDEWYRKRKEQTDKYRTKMKLQAAVNVNTTSESVVVPLTGKELMEDRLKAIRRRGEMQ